MLTSEFKKVYLRHTILYMYTCHIHKDALWSVSTSKKNNM